MIMHPKLPKNLHSPPASATPVAILPYWQWLVLNWAFVLAACFTFSCSPAILFYSDIPLSPAYELKSQSPLAETSALTEPPEPGERSHGAKLTRRLTGAFALFVTSKLGISYYWPASIGGGVLLLSALVVGERLTRDRTVALHLGLITAGLYATNACFSLNVSPKPFDGIAVGLIAASFIVARVSFQLPVLFLACWTDERAILAVLCLAAFTHCCQFCKSSLLTFSGAHLQYASVIVSYLLTRFFAGKWLGWQPADTSLVGSDFVATIPYAQLAVWTGLEGGLIMLVLAIVTKGAAIGKLERACLATLALAMFIANLMVIDVSRGAAFNFPLLFLSFGVLRCSVDNAHYLRRITLASAVLSLACPNFEVMAGIIFRPLPSLPIELFLRWATLSP